MSSPSSNNDIFQQCVASEGEDASAVVLLQCVTNLLQSQPQQQTASSSSSSSSSSSLDLGYLLILSAALVFFMQAGFAMLCAGSVQKKNVGNTMLKNLLDACGAGIAFWAVGYAFAYGGSDPNSASKTFIGHTNFFLMDVEDLGHWLFNYAFAAATATIVAGALAERCQMAAYLCYSLFLVSFVYPVIVHSIWSPQGFLSPFNVDPLWGTGVIDFAGTGVVHLTGGITALFAVIILGARRGRFHDDDGTPLDKPKEFHGHSVALQMLGCFILWFGWYSFNAGTTLVTVQDLGTAGTVAALAGTNTTLSGGMAGITALFVNLFIVERRTGEALFDLRFAMNGTLCGLIAITGGCAVIEPWAAVLVGFVAGLLYIAGTNAMIALRLDDAVDAVPCHMLNGLWGLISVGLLASPARLLAVYGRDIHVGWFYSWGRGSGDATLLGIQLVAILWIVGWTLALMMPFFVWLDYKGWFRSDPLSEIVGLDLSYHGGSFLGDSTIDPQYITAWEKQKEELRNRRGSQQSSAEMAAAAEEAVAEEHA